MAPEVAPGDDGERLIPLRDVGLWYPVIEQDKGLILTHVRRDAGDSPLAGVPEQVVRALSRPVDTAGLERRDALGPGHPAPASQRRPEDVDRTVGVLFCQTDLFASSSSCRKGACAQNVDHPVSVTSGNQVDGAAHGPGA